MTTSTNKKTLIAISIGVFSLIGLATFGIKTLSKKLENIFSFLDDDLVVYDEDDLLDPIIFGESERKSKIIPAFFQR